MSHPPNTTTTNRRPFEAERKIGTSTSASPRTVVVSPGTVAAPSSSFEPPKASHSSTRHHCNDEPVLAFSKSPPQNLTTESSTLETTPPVEAMRTCRTLQEELIQTQQDLWEGMMRELYLARYREQQSLQQVATLQKALQESDLALKHTTRQLELRTDQVQVLSKYIYNNETKKEQETTAAANENDKSSFLASGLLDGILPTSFSKQSSTPDRQTKNIMNME